MEKAYIYAMGCTENFLDAQYYTDFLHQNGYEIVEIIEEADIVIFVTCGVTTYIANECEEKYNFMTSKLKDGAKLIVCGCLPVIEKERVDRFNTLSFKSSHGDVSRLAKILNMDTYNWDESLAGHQFFTGPSINREEKHYQGAVATAVGRLKTLVELEKATDAVFNVLNEPKSLYFRRVTEEIYKDAYFVHVARGCGGNCTYCAVKFVKGDTKSKTIPQVVDEIKAGISLGKTEIVLAGDDVGSYGKDLEIDFYDLFTEINKLSPRVNYTVRNFEPFWMIHHLDKMEEILSEGAIVSICIPVQSGSNRILNEMKRNYHIEQVLEAVEILKRKHPSILFSTHFMVGFPGETPEDLEKTLDVLRKGLFDFLRYSMYTDRPNTAASKLENKIPLVEKMRRLKILEDLACEVFKQNYETVIKKQWFATLDRKVGEILSE